MEFRLIGPVEVLADGHPVDAGPPQRRAVLAALLVDAGRVVMPHVLVERVWGAQPPEGVRQALYAHIARLRRLLVEVPVACGEQPLPLSRRSGGYLLDVDPNSVDMRRFLWLVRRSREAGCGSTERSVALREALDLWRGEPLAGVAGQWAERMRVGWRQQHIEAVLAWVRGELDADNAAAAIARLTDLAEEYPLHEPALAALMAALHGAGLTAEALRRYSVLRRRLIDELGVEPGSQLRELHQRILRADANGVPSDMPPAAGPTRLPPDTPTFGMPGRGPSGVRASRARRRALARPGWSWTRWTAGTHRRAYGRSSPGRTGG